MRSKHKKRRRNKKTETRMRSKDKKGTVIKNWNKNEIQRQKRSNERLFTLTRTHSMQIFGEIAFIKPQNDT